MKDCDFVLLETISPYASVIKYYTQSEWTHIAPVLRRDRVLDFRREGKGVVSLEEMINDINVEDYRFVSDKENKSKEYLFDVIQELFYSCDYEFDKGLFRLKKKLVDGRDCLDVSSPDRVTCSSLIARAYHEINEEIPSFKKPFTPEGVHWSQVVPKDFYSRKTE